MLALSKESLFLAVKKNIPQRKKTTSIEKNKKFYHSLEVNENTKSYTYEKQYLHFC